jgi:hypothetical protein
MKKVLATIGMILGAGLFFLLYARVIGFDPGETAPGLWLSGEAAAAPTNWDELENLPGPSGIETRQYFASWLAHSVTAGRWHVDGKLYLASGYPAGITLPNGRHWNRNLMANPYVRVRIGNKIYEGSATYIEDGSERQALLRKYGPLFWSPGFYLHVWRVDPIM